MLNKLEKKFGKYAIPGLMRYLIVLYILGYVLYLVSVYTNTNFITYMTLEPYFIIHRFQFWRIFTWIMIPESSGIFYMIIMLILYYQLGTALENAWGTFRFNAYIFGGMLFTLIGAFILYGIETAVTGSPLQSVGGYFSMQYINLSIFLAFATCFPDMRVLLYFIIPIKMKWMGIVYAVLIVINLISAGWAQRVAIIASLLNFVIFFIQSRDYKRNGPKQAYRKAEFRRSYNQGQQANQRRQQTYGQGQPYGQQTQSQSKQISRHKCAICGRTELTNPELEFRFCSKCNGNYEYCSDHLFTHTHKV